MEGNSVKVEFMYEPPQENNELAFQLLDDPQKVLTVALG
jgi:hypothetical protein